MSKSSRSAINGMGVGLLIGIVFGIAVLSTMGFDRLSLFEDLLLVSCAAFGGGLFGSLIGVTGAFRSEAEEAAQASAPLIRPTVSGAA